MTLTEYIVAILADASIPVSDLGAVRWWDTVTRRWVTITARRFAASAGSLVEVGDIPDSVRERMIFEVHGEDERFFRWSASAGAFEQVSMSDADFEITPEHLRGASP